MRSYYFIITLLVFVFFAIDLRYNNTQHVTNTTIAIKSILNKEKYDNNCNNRENIWKIFLKNDFNENFFKESFDNIEKVWEWIIYNDAISNNITEFTMCCIIQTDNYSIIGNYTIRQLVCM